jgi:hypothetical protein
MNDLETVIDTYLSAWNETDSTARAALIAKAWADGAQLVDPPAAGVGADGINQIADALHGQFPRHQFRRASAIDAHHDAFRFAWELVAPDGSVTLSGLDVGQLAPDGRLSRITGFFGPLAGDQVA